MTTIPSTPRERIATQCVCCGNMQLQASPAILMPFVAHRVFGWRPVVIDASWGLNTIANGHAYSICNSLYCGVCDFLFLDIRFSDAELSRLYQDYRGPDYVELRELYEPGYRERNRLLLADIPYLDQIENFIAPHIAPNPAILDWGGDTGKNTPFKSKNKCLHIYDISQKPTIAGAKSVSAQETLASAYDLIVCSEVLEHIPYPCDILQAICLRMDKNSTLYLEVPHEPVMQENKNTRPNNKKHWHEHINFFSTLSMKKLLDQCALETINIQSTTIKTGGEYFKILQIIAKLK